LLADPPARIFGGVSGRGEELETARLWLVPITVPVVEAMLSGQRARAEALVDARLPDAWPGRALVERAFSASIAAIRDHPERRLWGDRVAVTREHRRVVGSVVFHGAPLDGVVEMAYGIESESQGQGYATEATSACLSWALAQPDVRVVRATTPPFHAASRRVLEKIGMRLVGFDDHDLFGELCRYERAR
jgi:ribosomal-protein-alanine N-acetyltransferase